MLSRGAKVPIPALLTSRVKLASFFSVSSTRARSPLLLRSAGRTSMERLVSLVSRAANWSSLPRLRATIVKSYPRRARRSAYTAPMPDDAPVISAVPLLGLVIIVLLRLIARHDRRGQQLYPAT